jgi:hypothetical protein
MANDNTGSAWQFFIGLPLWLKSTVALVGMGLLCFVVFGVSFLIINRNMEVQIGLTGFTATRPETTLEKNCRMASQEASARDQSFNSEILALQAQVAIKDHDLSEIRQKCLAEPPPKHTDSSRCNTEIHPFAIGSGGYESVLTTIAQERQDLESRIVAKEKERARWQQRLDQRCVAEAPP